MVRDRYKDYIENFIREYDIPLHYPKIEENIILDKWIDSFYLTQSDSYTLWVCLFEDVCYNLKYIEIGTMRSSRFIICDISMDEFRALNPRHGNASGLHGLKNILNMIITMNQRYCKKFKLR